MEKKLKYNLLQPLKIYMIYVIFDMWMSEKKENLWINWPFVVAMIHFILVFVLLYQLNVEDK